MSIEECDCCYDSEHYFLFFYFIELQSMLQADADGRTIRQDYQATSSVQEDTNAIILKSS